MDLSYKIINIFKNTKDKTIETLKNIAIEEYNKIDLSDNSFDLEIVVGQITNNIANLYQISPYNNFEIINTKLDEDGVIVWSAGIKTKESFDEMSNNILSNKSIIQSYINTFNNISFEGIGGYLSIYQLDFNGIKKIHNSKIKEKNIKYFNNFYLNKHLIIGERVIGKILMGHNLILSDPDGYLQILGNKGTVRDRCLDPREDSPTYLRGREVMRFGLYNYDTHGVDDYRNPHPIDQTLDKFGIQLYGKFSDVLTVDNQPPIIGSSNGIPDIYNAQPLSRVTMDSNDGFWIDKWENRDGIYDWYKKFYVDSEGSLFAEDMTTYRLKIYQKPDVLLLDAENRFINIGRMAEMVLDGALTPIEKIQVRLEWARIEQEFIELQKAYLEHRYTYRGGDEFGNKSTLDHLNIPSSPAWEGTEFAKYSMGFWDKFEQEYNELNQYLNIDIITLPNHPDYPNGSLLSDARKHITEREDDYDDSGKVLEFGTGFDRQLFINTFNEYYNATKVLVDAINTLIRWASTELGQFYNDIRIDAEDGIVVTRSNNKNQVWLSATDGFSIAINQNYMPFTYYPFLEYSKPGAEISGSRTMQDWQKVFYVDTSGNLNMLGSLDMLSLNDQVRVLIDQNSTDNIPFSIMGRSRSIGIGGDIRPYERFSDHTGDWWRKLYIDTEGNLFANDLTANRLILRDNNGDVIIDANSGFLDLTKLPNIHGTIGVENLFAGMIVASEGFINNLAVNKLKSIPLGAVGEVHYIDIHKQTMQFNTTNVTETGQYEVEAYDIGSDEVRMMPVYWRDSSMTSVTIENTGLPVMIQDCGTPVTSMELTFDSSHPNHLPKIILGTGTGLGDRGKGVIYKDYIGGTDQGLMVNYSDTQGRERTIRFDDDGVSFNIGSNKLNLIRGKGNFKSAVTFPTGQIAKDTNYSVLITPNADPNGYIGEWWVTNKSTSGFTIQNSGTATTGFDYVVI